MPGSRPFNPLVTEHTVWEDCQACGAESTIEITTYRRPDGTCLSIDTVGCGSCKSFASHYNHERKPIQPVIRALEVHV